MTEAVPEKEFHEPLELMTRTDALRIPVRERINSIYTTASLKRKGRCRNEMYSKTQYCKESLGVCICSDADAARRLR